MLVRHPLVHLRMCGASALPLCILPLPLSLYAADGAAAHLCELLSDSPALFLSPPSPGGADGAVAHLRQPRCVAHSTVRLLSAGYEWYPVA